MFAPNRLLTTKEQWLLVGFIVAIITGCATAFLHGKGNVQENSSATVVIPAKAQTQTPQSKPETEAIAAPESQAVEKDLPVVQSPAPPKIIGVAVMGAVRHPDLYMVEEGLRIADLIALAGGVEDNADLSDILLTATLVDETTLTVPELPDVTMNETQVVVRRGAATSVVNPFCYRRHREASLYYAPSSTSQDTPAPVAHSVSNSTASPAGGLLNINQATSEQLQGLPGIGPVFAERIIQERNKQPFNSVEELRRVSGIADKRLEAIRSLITAP